MSTKENIEQDNNFFEVVTLRDYFAAKAMQGILSNEEARMKMVSDAKNSFGKKDKSIEVGFAKFCYDYADAMMEARECK